MSYQERLEQEINKKLDDLARMEELWKAPWIAHSICLDHSAGLAPPPPNNQDTSDRSFWQHGGYLHTRRTVTQVINKRAGSSKDEQKQTGQLVLNGFERNRLHDYYVVIRDGEEVGVPIIGPNQMTDEEIDTKAGEYDAMSLGCAEHRDELLRFKEWRQNQTSMISRESVS